MDVGDFLRFKSCVLFTQRENLDQPLINIEVEAHVTRPELRSSEVRNELFFPFHHICVLYNHTQKSKSD